MHAAPQDRVPWQAPCRVTLARRPTYRIRARPVTQAQHAESAPSALLCNRCVALRNLQRSEFSHSSSNQRAALDGIASDGWHSALSAAAPLVSGTTAPQGQDALRMICENLASAKAQLLARVSAPLALSFGLLRDVEPTLKSATVRCGESLALYVGTVLRLSGCSASCRVVCSISVTSSECK